MKKPLIQAVLEDRRVLTEASDGARELFNQSCFGAMKGSRVQLSLLEACYLVEKERVELLDGRGKPIAEETFMRKARKLEPNFLVRYSVFKDIRDRGYVIKTALKFGADFRVYNRGIKPGQDHARWVVYAVHEGSTLTWHDFAAKNRVSHSTKKRLLVGVVDDEGEVSYWEIRWLRP